MIDPAMQEPAVASAIIFSDGMIREQFTAKISLIGIFDRLSSPGFPFLAKFFVTAFITNLRGSRKPLSVTLRLEKEDSGHVVCSSSAKLQFGEKSPNFDPSDVVQVPMPTVANFAEPGPYTAVILVDNEEAGKAALRVDALTVAGQRPTKETP
ncbi:DUF6941 family protein [Methylacidimicrobium tartarophylax]|nr:hypothetical protein [Methylacidimicrobium tartarophylax]